MSTPTTLLTLPTEIRLHIYSYALLNEDVIDMIAGNVPCSGLFLSCRKLHSEAFEYYYEENTFQLSLCDPIYSPGRFHCGIHPGGDLTLMKRLGNIRNLHLEIGTYISDLFFPFSGPDPESPDVLGELSPLVASKEQS